MVPETRSAPKVLVFFGTRPEAIKMAPVVRALRGAAFEPVVINTGQHNELLEGLARDLDLKVDHRLQVLRKGQSLGRLAGRLLTELDPLLEGICADGPPHCALVQGDTSTTLGAALSCFYRGIAVGHIEAGLRTHRLDSPFPEEAHRQLITRVSTLHFAPTVGAKENLISEGVPETHIIVTGNTVIDALRWEQSRQHEAAHRNHCEATLATALPKLPDLETPCIITLHRRENRAHSKQLQAAFKELFAAHPEQHFVHIAHPNGLELPDAPNLHRTPALPYPAFVALLHRARLLISDSGGLQEEACGLGLPLILLRKHSERPEAENEGSVLRCTFDGTALRRAVSLAEQQPRTPSPLYGDGQAAEAIVAALTSARA